MGTQSRTFTLGSERGHTSPVPDSDLKECQIPQKRSFKIPVNNLTLSKF